MAGRDQKRYQDVVIVNVGRGSSPTSKKNGRNPLLHILVTVLVTVLLIVTGYLGCVKAGLIAPPHGDCCFGIIELNLDFDFDVPDADA